MRCVHGIGTCVKPEQGQKAKALTTYESSKPGQCASYLYVKTAPTSNAKRWVELREDRGLYTFSKKGDTTQLEEIQLTHDHHIEVLDTCVLRSQPGFEIVVPGLLNSNCIFYCESVQDRDYWLHHLRLSLKIQKQFLEEKQAEYLWGDLRPKESGEGNSSRLSSKEKKRKKKKKKKKSCKQEKQIG